MAKDLTVAHTIVQQLGGRQFIAMTGARGFAGTETSVMFGLPIGDVRMVRISLEPSDTYTVSFYPVGGGEPEVHHDIYCDTLRSLFERATGLYTSLVPRRHVHLFVDKKV